MALGKGKKKSVLRIKTGNKQILINLHIHLLRQHVFCGGKQTTGVLSLSWEPGPGLGRRDRLCLRVSIVRMGRSRSIFFQAHEREIFLPMNFLTEFLLLPGNVNLPEVLDGVHESEGTGSQFMLSPRWPHRMMEVWRSFHQRFQTWRANSFFTDGVTISGLTWFGNNHTQWVTLFAPLSHLS